MRWVWIAFNMLALDKYAPWMLNIEFEERRLFSRICALEHVPDESTRWKLALRNVMRDTSRVHAVLLAAYDCWVTSLSCTHSFALLCWILMRNPRRAFRSCDFELWSVEVQFSSSGLRLKVSKSSIIIFLQLFKSQLRAFAGHNLLYQHIRIPISI